MTRNTHINERGAMGLILVIVAAIVLAAGAYIYMSSQKGTSSVQIDNPTQNDMTSGNQNGTGNTDAMNQSLTPTENPLMMPENTGATSSGMQESSSMMESNSVSPTSEQMMQGQ